MLLSQCQLAGSGLAELHFCHLWCVSVALHIVTAPICQAYTFLPVLQLSHDCLNGFAQTVTIGGELVNFYRNKNEQCLFSGDTVLLSSDQSWCVSMQDVRLLLFGSAHLTGLEGLLHLPSAVTDIL